ncbi:Ig-like domain-containing protein [Microvirga pudoricolor]|uniref:Ig-like domain-containing protein n=1 Tax=Microvirga pudoricolor TaxID=2778729 RepID=UPI0019504EF7|nr:Ig-like domain-containing protein [Microvirga pudoricolor]MBM6594153.1 cadherin-like domain-containing protein [Microvirga pudoricolor]
MATDLEILTAFNQAADAESLVSAIETHKADLLSNEDPDNNGPLLSDLAQYDTFPAGFGRQEAVANGLTTFKVTFGAFQSVDDIRQVLTLNVNTEYAKQEFIRAIDGAVDADGVEAAIVAFAGQLSDDRQDLIELLSGLGAPAAGLVAYLQTELYTVAFKYVADHLDDEGFVSALAQDLFAAREQTPQKQFYGVLPVAAAIDEATGAALLDAVNNAADENEIIAILEAAKGDLLNGADLANYDALPDGLGRQKAVGLGIEEYRDLFGSFATLPDLQKAVKLHVTTEFHKQELITGIDAATDVASMKAALGEAVDNASEDRQALILEWSGVEQPDAVQARAAALSYDVYTSVLKYVADGNEDPDFVSSLAETLVESRTGPFFGVTAIVNAILKADSGALVAAVNAAKADPDASTILDLINGFTGQLTDSTTADLLDDLPLNGGRQQAVALGVQEIARLFGNFENIETLQDAVTTQVKVEHNKYVLINALDGAVDADAMAEAISDTIQAVNADRQDLIDAWSESDLPAVLARVAQLEADPYTKALVEVAAHVDNEAYLSKIAGAVYEARLALDGDKFFGVGKIVTALQAASDDAIIEIFNDATEQATSSNVANLMAVIDEFAVSLLDTDAYALYQQLPDGGGRQKAVALGVDEIKELFGAFASVSDIKAALSLHVETEFNKQAFITSLDGAADEDAMVDALRDTVAAVYEDRASLIAEWSTSSDEDVQDRVAALRADPYTLALAEAYANLDDDTYIMQLAREVFEARQTGDGRFFGVAEIVTAMNAVNFVPVVGAALTLVTNEDVAITGSVGASDYDGEALAYTLKAGSAPTKGVVQLNADGTFVYTPGQDLNGNDSFTVVVTDARGASAEKTIAIGINPVNDAPGDIGLSNAVVAENSASGTVVGSLSAFDLDGDSSFNFALLNDAGGRFSVQNGNLVVADGLGLDYEQATSHTIIVRATDAGGFTFDKALTVYLTDVVGEQVAGTATSDVIVGGAGRDVISGGLGRDILTGGKGKDTFVFDTKLTKNRSNVDTITDFNVKDDTMKLDNAIFKKLGKGTEKKPGKLDKDFFTVGTKAQDANDYLIYNSKKGTLSYDADGSGKGAAIVFATLSKNLKMTDKDFLIV